MKLLEHFKELTLHPKNAEELKGLILQLAVQGKLTRQWREDNPAVEPASVLLERISDEKARLIKENKIKKEKPLAEISEQEMPYEIPAGWIWCRLGEIITLKSGQDLTPNEYSDINQIGLPYITGASNLQNEEVIVSRWTNKPRSIAYEGDLLLTCKGSGVGKMGWLKEVEAHIARQIMAVNTIFSRLEFIKLFLDIKLKYFKKVANGLIPGIDRKTVLEIPFPLPSLEEQKAIVEIVNQLFAEVEQLEALTKERIQLKAHFVNSSLNQLTQAAEQDTASQWAFLQQQFGTFFTEKSTIKKLREGILQLAVQGKLTHQWRTLRQAEGIPMGFASELLEKIKAEKVELIKAGKIKKERPLPEISDDEIPYELPEGWVWCRMGEITEKLGAGSTPTGGKNAYEDGGIMFFRSQNVHNYFLKLEQVAYISDETHEKMKGTKVVAQDLLLNITGGSIGRCALIPDDFETANVSQHVAIVRLVELDLRKYIHSLIVSNQFQETIMDVQVGVSREGLSMTKLKLFLVPLPPLEEQKAIVEKVNALIALCDKLEQEIEANQTTQEEWMESCLREVVEN